MNLPKTIDRMGAAVVALIRAVRPAVQRSASMLGTILLPTRTSVISEAPTEAFFGGAFVVGPLAR